MASRVSDAELRKRLERHGYHPGPITETTRELYLTKLRSLEETDDGARRSGPERPEATPPPEPEDQSHLPTDALGISPPTHTPNNAQGIYIIICSHCVMLSVCRSSLAVVDLLVSSLNDPAHVASDTVFMFHSGEVLLASRAVLATQCNELIPLLYSREGLYNTTTHFPLIRSIRLMLSLVWSLKLNL